MLLNSTIAPILSKSFKLKNLINILILIGKCHMKIMILAHALRAGGGRATCANLLKAIMKIDNNNLYYIIVPDQAEYRDLKLESERIAVEYYSRSFGHLGRRFFDLYLLPQKARRVLPDVIWSMGGIGLINPPCPQLISIQNPYVIYPPENWGRLRFLDRIWVYAVRAAFRKQLPRSQRVICQTATMEKRLHEVYGYEGGTLVTWKAVSAFATEWDGEVPALIKTHVDMFKLLYVTRYYPHKGLEILVDTIDLYREELDNVVCFITIEAEQHPFAASILKRIREKGLEKLIINIGPLSQKDLARWYHNCDALLMPTLLESFSGSYLEAMHFGLPILTSDLDFAHEICEDAALYFDPWDSTSIKETILRIKQSKDLAHSLREKGRVRLRGMYKTWEDIAKEILREIHTVAFHCSSEKSN